MTRNALGLVWILAGSSLAGCSDGTFGGGAASFGARSKPAQGQGSDDAGDGGSDALGDDEASEGKDGDGQGDGTDAESDADSDAGSDSADDGREDLGESSAAGGSGSDFSSDEVFLLHKRLQCEDDIKGKKRFVPPKCEKYKYVSTLPSSIADANSRCEALGSGWKLANIDRPCELVEIQDYLSSDAVSAVHSTSTGPLVNNTCQNVTSMSWGEYGKINLDCSGSLTVVNWLDNDKCDAGLDGFCSFLDVRNANIRPFLCENTGCDIEYED